MATELEEKAYRHKFSHTLRDLRKASGIKQEDFADLTDLSQPTLSRFERGVVLPRVLEIKRMAAALGLSTGEFSDLVDAHQCVCPGFHKTPRADLHILCSAVHYDDGKAREHEPVTTGIVHSGYRHSTLRTLLCELYGQSWRTSYTYGFLTSVGTFVDREEAMRIATAAHQTRSAKPDLYSEDLYSLSS